MPDWNSLKFTIFFLIYNDYGEYPRRMGIHTNSQIHELFINYYDNGEWEDMPYEYMRNMVQIIPCW